MHVLAALSVDSISAPVDAVSSFRVVLGVYAVLLLMGLATIFILGARPRFQPILWQEHVAWLGSRPWTWLMAGRIGLILSGLQLAAVVFWRIAMVTGLLTSDELESSWVLVQGLIFHVAGLLTVMVVIRRANLSWRDVFGIGGGDLARRAGHGVVGYLAVLPVFFGASLVYQLVLVLFGYPLSMQDVVSVFLEPRSGYDFAINLVLALVIAPVAEEVLFRGFLLPLLARSWGAAPAILVTSLLFALLHFHVPSVAPLFVLALAFSIAYIRTQSIVVPVVMHVLFNGMNLGFLLVLALFET